MNEPTRPSLLTVRVVRPGIETLDQRSINGIVEAYNELAEYVMYLESRLERVESNYVPITDSRND